MTGYQFHHLESYARVAGKKKTGGHSIYSISAEAERQAGACDHVPSPQPPSLLYGCMPSEAAQQAAAWAEKAKDSRGHALRKDGLCLGGGVITWPAERSQEEWEAYRDSSIAWLRSKHGNRLLSVVEHLDEPHKHIHYYLIPQEGERFDVLHPGRAAAAGAKAAGNKKGEQNTAYIVAMRQWQVDFHREVSAHHGLTRLGPRRRRLTRAEWKAEQVEAERQAKELNRIKRSGDLVDLASSNLAEATKMAEAERQRLTTERQALQKIIAAARQESAARAGEIQTQAAKAFQSGIDSRSRQKEWQRQRLGLISSPPSGLTYSQIERRQELARGWDWLEDPAEIRRRAVSANRQGREALAAIEDRQRQARERIRHREIDIREIRERLQSVKPLQLFEKSRLGGELRAAEKDLAEARADQKHLAETERKLLASCPVEVVDKFRQRQEEAREKALAALLAQEAQEIEEERFKEAAEAKARQERMAMRPAASKKKPGGWTPPSPS